MFIQKFSAVRVYTFYQPIKITVSGNEICVRTQTFANVWSQIRQNMSDFQPLEVVGRGNETQLQVGKM